MEKGLIKIPRAPVFGESVSRDSSVVRVSGEALYYIRLIAAKANQTMSFVTSQMIIQAAELVELVPCKGNSHAE